MHPLIAEVQKSSLKKIPEIKPGTTVRVQQKIKEGEKERVQAFEGLVIAIGHGQGVEKTFTVRKTIEGVGVEKVFPLHSPNVVKIEVKKTGRVRRAKLYFMRGRSGKSTRLAEEVMNDAERAAEEAKREALVEEAVEAEKKRKREEAAVVKASGEGEAQEAAKEV